MSLKIESNYSKKKNSSLSSIANLIYNLKKHEINIVFPPPPQKKNPIYLIIEDYSSSWFTFLLMKLYITKGYIA